MDRRERSGDGQASMIAAMSGLQATIWTALPGIVQSFDPAKRTCTVQPTIEALVQAPDGSKDWTVLPLLLDCPVVFPGGGGFVLTFPLAQGDEVLVVFASRCIDSWWQSGGIQVQAELRMHDLSDGFAIGGPRSVPSVEAGISTSKVQLRNAAGTARVEIDPAGNIAVVSPANVTATAAGNVTATAAGNASITAAGSASVTAGSVASVTAPAINLTGNVTITGNLALNGGSATLAGALAVAGEVTAAGVPLSSHKHGGVTSGGSDTGGPHP